MSLIESTPRVHDHLTEIGTDHLRIKSQAPLRDAAIVIVAYNASSTITGVLDRIPSTVAEHIGAIVVSDDCSSDDTAAVARQWASDHPTVPVTVIRQAVNLGYGGNQKFCYEWARQRGLRYALMVHGDGQYAPELAMRMLRPLLGGHGHAVFGSRMMTRGGALLGGMPLYKYAGNRILTFVQNRCTGLRLTEWHSGYRAYDLEALGPERLALMSDGFDFDTEIILELARTRRRIIEQPIPTYYGNEKCHVSGMRYAKDVLVDVARYRAGRHALAA